MPTPAERALLLTEEYLAARDNRAFFGDQSTSREPAEIADEWLRAMREALAES